MHVDCCEMESFRKNDAETTFAFYYRDFIPVAKNSGTFRTFRKRRCISAISYALSHSAFHANASSGERSGLCVYFDGRS